MDSKPQHKDLSALIMLLDEPNANIYSNIRDRIFSFGVDAIPSLENAWENSFDDLLQQRILDLIHEIQFENTFLELNQWAHFNFNDLMEAYLIVAKFAYPDLDIKSMKRQLNKIIKDVWLEINDNLTALEKVKVINHVLFEIFNFKSNRRNFYSPDNFFINKLLETRTGNPLSLGGLYLIIAKGLNLPIYGVNLPRHFILAYADEVIEGEFKLIRDNEMLFYINPFNKGAVFTRNEIDLYLKQAHLRRNKDFYLPCDNRSIIERLLRDLVESYNKLGNKEKVGELKRLIEAVVK